MILKDISLFFIVVPRRLVVLCIAVAQNSHLFRFNSHIYVETEDLFSLSQQQRWLPIFLPVDVLNTQKSLFLYTIF